VRLPLSKLGRTKPEEGTLFRSYGHNASKLEVVLAIGSFVEVIVCDDCLRAAAANGRVLHGRPVPVVPPPVQYTLATVDDDGQLMDGESPWTRD
jgi:hypothetical protein